MGPVSAYDMYGNTTSERENIEFYKNKIDKLKLLEKCEDKKCKSCNPE